MCYDTMISKSSIMQVMAQTKKMENIDTQELMERV